MTDRHTELERLTATIQGWLHPQAGAALYEMARGHAPITAPAVVELGAWKGRSTAWLAAGVRDREPGRGGKVYAVDTWEGSSSEPMHAEMLAGYGPGQLFREFQSNIERLGLTGFVEPIVSGTIAAAKAWPLDRPIGLLYIDACHDYAAVRRDFEFWSPHVIDGGIIAFDDVPAWPGPTRLVSELPRWWQQAGAWPNLWIVQKQL